MIKMQVVRPIKDIEGKERGRICQLCQVLDSIGQTFPEHNENNIQKWMILKDYLALTPPTAFALFSTLGVPGWPRAGGRTAIPRTIFCCFVWRSKKFSLWLWLVKVFFCPFVHIICCLHTIFKELFCPPVCEGEGRQVEALAPLSTWFSEPYWLTNFIDLTNLSNLTSLTNSTIIITRPKKTYDRPTWNHENP